MLWNVKTGKLLRRLRGHDAAVTAVAVGDGLVVTGSADRDVRVWTIQGSRSNPVKTAELKYILRGHKNGVSAVAVNGKDVVSGDRAGRLIIWNAATGAAVRMLDTHTNAITCLQFDSTKIISASNDGTVKMTDTMSGGIISTPLRRLESPIVSLQFDSHSLIAVSVNRSLYSFRFQGVGTRVILREHILNPREAIPTVARKYGVETADVMKWNSISDPSDIYDGMRLIVQQPVVAAQNPALQ
jgi:WD40 repeat protein